MKNDTLIQDLINQKHECEAPNSQDTATAKTQKSTHFEGYFCRYAIGLAVSKIDTENEWITSVRDIY